MALPQMLEIINSRAEQAEPRRRAAQFARHRDHRPGSGSAAQHRVPAVQIAQRGHRDHPLRAGDQIAADDSRAEQTRFGPHPVAEFGHLCRRGVRRRAESDHEGRHPRTHRLDIRGVLRNRLAAHVMRAGPVETKMTTLDEHVGAHRDPSVRRIHDGGVIARSHPNSGRPASSGIQPVDHGELSQLLQRGVGAVCHRVSLFQPPWGPALP